MGNIFSANEVLEIAIQIEKNGQDFYKTLSNKTKNNNIKQIFEFLAGEEEKHIKTFTGILSKIDEYQPPESYSGEFSSYMKALASEHVFTKANQGTQIALATKSDNEAITLAMGFEKDSIIFYEGIKKIVPDYQTKIIDELISQEQNHLRKLFEIKSALK